MISGLLLLSALLVAQPAPDPVAPLLSQLAQRPGDSKLANEARMGCRAAHQSERCIDALNALVAQHPQVVEARYNAALAYVDELPGHSILRQGQLSSRSMDHASAVLATRPDDWLALYIRGMNHLYWPLLFRHIDSALTDLRHCVRAVERLPSKERKRYHALAYLALGDAAAKKGEPAQARDAWRRANELDEGVAAERLRLTDGEQRDFVGALRDLDKPIDTDLAFLWKAP